MSSYRIESSNVLIGRANVATYSFLANVDSLDIQRLDGPATVYVHGTLNADDLTIESLTTSNTVLHANLSGALETLPFPVDGLGNASALTTGILPTERLRGDYTFDNLTATHSITAGTLIGHIDASHFTTGRLPPARLAGGTYTFANLTLTGNAVSSTLTANLDANDIVVGTIRDQQLQGSYAFDSLTLTSNLDAAWVHADLDANDLTSGILHPDRLRLPLYSFDGLTVSETTTVDDLRITSTTGDRVVLLDENGYVVSGDVAVTELQHVSGVTGPIQSQMNELANGNIVGSNILDLSANNITFGILPDARLVGEYSVESLTLTGELVADTVNANLDASQLTRGTVPDDRMTASTYRFGNVVCSSVTANIVTANMDASRIVNTVPDARMNGSYSFDALTLSGDAIAGTVRGNIDASSLASGILDHDRLQYDGLRTNVVPIDETHALGSVSDPWNSVYATTVHVSNSLDVSENVVYVDHGRVVLDLEQTFTNICPAPSSTLSVGTETIPWENVVATNVDVRHDVILHGSLLNEAGGPFIDLANLESNIVPATPGLSVGTAAKPWSVVVANSIETTALVVDGNVLTTVIPVTSNLDVGTSSTPWAAMYADVVHANLDVSNVSGQLVSDVVFVGGSVDGLTVSTLGGTSQNPGLYRIDGTSSTGIFVDVDGTLGFVTANVASVRLNRDSLVVSGNLCAIAEDVDLGSAEAPWHDLFVSNAMYVGTGNTRLTLGSTVSGVERVVANDIECSNVIASWSAAASSFEGNVDASQIVTGTLEPNLFSSGSYVLSNVVANGTVFSTSSTSLTPTTHVLPFSSNTYDLGSASQPWRDLWVSASSLRLGTTTIHEVDGNIVIPRLVVDGAITGPLDDVLLPMTCDSIEIADDSWTPTNALVLPSEGGNIVVHGSGFGSTTLVKVGGVNASSTSFVSSTMLRVTLGARPNGTYDVLIVRGDSKSVTVPLAVTYSTATSWTTSTVLGNVEQFRTFSIPLAAVSDSTIAYSNTTSLPSGVTLDGNNGTLSGTITSNVTTLYSIGVQATDEESQTAARTFLLQHAKAVYGTKLDVPLGASDASHFGQSVSVSGDGSRAAVGSPGFGTTGAVIVYTATDGTWGDVKVLEPVGGAAGARFGHSVSLNFDGSMLAVGSPLDQSAGGLAYVYTHTGSTWTETTIEPPITLDGSSSTFGWSVSLTSDGDRLLVGMPEFYNFLSASFSIGRGVVFSHQSGTWTQEAVLSGSDVTANRQLGASVSIRDVAGGTVAILGAPMRSGNDGGAYAFFSEDGTTTWTQISLIEPPVTGGNMFFGTSVALSEDGRGLVGSRGGGASVYSMDRDLTSWTETNVVSSSGSIPSSYSYYGGSVAASSDGRRIAVGAGGTNSNIGSVHVYRRESGQWIEETEIAYDEPSSDFGWRVSFDEGAERLVITADWATVDGSEYAGMAFVYVRNGTTWSLESSIESPSPQTNAFFGCSAAMSRDGYRMVIGEFGHSADDIQMCGRAHVYVRSPVTGSWTLEQSLSADPLIDRGSFGQAVSIDGTGDRVIIGSTGYSPTTGAESMWGTAFVFTRTDSSWAQETKLEPPVDDQPTSTPPYFGWSVSMTTDGTRIAIGEPHRYVNRPGGTIARDGAVRVYVRSGTTWVEEAMVTTPSPLPSTFGKQVSINDGGDRLAIGDPDATVDGTEWVGKAFVFSRTTTSTESTWTQTHEFSAPVQTTNATFGSATSFDSSGDVLVIGSQGESTFRGSAYVYTASRTFSSEATLSLPSTQSGTLFGNSVSLNRDATVAAVCASSFDGDGGTDTGGVFLFGRDVETSIWTPTCSLVAFDQSNGLQFGTSVSLGGESRPTMFVGVPRDSVLYSDDGSAYAFVDRASIDPNGAGPDQWTSTEIVPSNIGQLVNPVYLGGKNAVSGDGNTIAVAAFGNDVIYTYSRDANGWTDEQTLSGVAGSYFGASISLDAGGTRMAVGSHVGTRNGYSSGLVDMYVRDGNVWASEGQVSVAQDSVRFGYATSLDGTGSRLLVGGHQYDYFDGVGNVVDSGGAWVYKRDDSNVWSQEAALVPTVVQAGAGAGVFVDLDQSGTLAVVGADKYDYVQTTEPPNLGSATGSGAGPYTLNGYAVTASSVWDATYIPTKAFNKTNVDVTDCWHSGPGTSLPQWLQIQFPAAKTVASYSITGRLATNSWPRTWTLQGSSDGSSWTTLDTVTNDTTLGNGTKNTYTVDSPGSYTYYRVYITATDGGTHASIAELEFYPAQADQGTVFVFRRTANAWTEEAQLTASDGAAYDTFGRSVRVSGDGSTVVVGAPQHDTDGLQNSGKVYVFSASGNVWTETAQLIADEPADTDYFGRSVAVNYDGTRAFVGAFLKDTYATDTGMCYVYEKVDGTWSLVRKLVDGDLTASAEYGVEISTSSNGGTFLVGAQRNNSDTGAAFAYDALTWSAVDPYRSYVPPVDPTQISVTGLMSLVDPTTGSYADPYLGVTWTATSVVLEGGFGFFDMRTGYLTASTSTVLPQNYTLFYVWYPRLGDYTWRTLFRGTNDHWIIMNYPGSGYAGGDQSIGIWSNRDGTWRDSGYDVTFGWQTLIVVGNGSSVSSATGTQTFYVNGTQVGATDRVASGDGFVNIGYSTNQFPGLVAVAGAYDKALNSTEIAALNVALTSRIPVNDYFMPPVQSGLVGHYDGSQWASTQWRDTSGYGNHAVIGGSGLGTSTLNSRVVLTGSTATTITWPSGILPATFTLFHVTRYDSPDAAWRIIQGVTTNWLNGHYGGYAGVAHHNGWIGSYPNTSVGQYSWVLSTGTNTAYRVNGSLHGSTGSGTPNYDRICINAGLYNQNSSWQCAEVIVYNRTLNATEVASVESYLNEKYALGLS